MCLVSQLLSKITYILQFLHQMFNMSTLLLDDAFKLAMSLTNGVINEMQQQFASFTK